LTAQSWYACAENPSYASLWIAEFFTQTIVASFPLPQILIRRLHMPTRKAHARWEGDLKEGKGKVDFGNGAFKASYSFDSRFDNGTRTHPEESHGAAHASCFAMALSLMLGKAGLKPAYVDATALVTVS